LAVIEEEEQQAVRRAAFYQSLQDLQNSGALGTIGWFINCQQISFYSVTLR
jgi:hypothetical protein